MDDSQGHKFIIPRVKSTALPYCLNCYVSEPEFKQSSEECKKSQPEYVARVTRPRLVKMDVSPFHVVIKEDSVPIPSPKIQHRAEVLFLIENSADMTDVYKFFADKYEYNEETTVHALAENGVTFPAVLNSERKREVKILDRKQQLQELSITDLDPWDVETSAHMLR